MVFIRPTIVRNGSKLSDISKQKYNYMRALQLDRRSRGVALMPDKETPVMNDWNSDLTLPPSFEEYLNEKGAIKEELKEQQDD